MLINTITRYRKLLRASVLVNVAAFGAAYHIANIQRLLPTALTNVNTFGAPTVTHGPRNLLPTTFANTNTFGSPTIAHGNSHLLPTTFANTNTFGSPTIASQSALTLLPTMFAETNSFGAPAIALVKHWSYSNAGGTGNRTSSIATSFSSPSGGTLGAGTINNLVDGGFGTNSTDGTWFNGAKSDWVIKFDFGSPRVIKQARWYQELSGTSHGTWKWRGSNDDSTYTDIGGTFSLGINNSGGTFQSLVELIGNTIAYRYYALVQQTGPTNSGPWLTEIEFFTDGTTNDNPDTNYTYPCGGGVSTIGNGFGNVSGSGGNSVDRSSLITVTASFTPGGSSLLSNLIDGVAGNTDADSLTIANGLTNAVIKFDFGSTPQRINELTWEQNGTTGQGNYDFAGSDDDSSYTTLSSNFDLVNGTANRVLSFTNTAAYRYYKLTQVSGTTSSTPRVHEIYFKTAPKTVT